jgi:hypothetical protein
MERRFVHPTTHVSWTCQFQTTAAMLPPPAGRRTRIEPALRGKRADWLPSPESADPSLVCPAARGGFGQLFLDGLLGTERRKTGRMRAEAAGDARPRRVTTRWKRYADTDAALVTDEIGSLK